ncbi:MAG: hypothetical protein ACYTHN_21620, partial [Planctomycetota bacterium]
MHSKAQGLRFLTLMAVPLLLLIGCSEGDYTGDFARVVYLETGLGPNNPPPASINAGAVNVSMLQLRLNAGPDEQVRVNSISFTGSGSGDESADIFSVDLFVDADGNGQPSGPDIPLGVWGTFFFDDGKVTFSNINRIIQASAEETWLLVYTFSGAASMGDTFSASLADPTDLVAEGGQSERPAEIRGTPVNGPVMTISNIGTLTIAPGTANPPSASIFPSSTNVAVMQLALTVGIQEAITVDTVTVTASGTGNDAADISAVDLFVDANNDGVYQAGTDIPSLGSCAYSADNGQITFSPGRA